LLETLQETQFPNAAPQDQPWGYLVANSFDDGEPSKDSSYIIQAALWLVAALPPGTVRPTPNATHLLLRYLLYQAATDCASAAEKNFAPAGQRTVGQKITPFVAPAATPIAE